MPHMYNSTVRNGVPPPIYSLYVGVLQCHYLWITPIIQDTCAEFNIKYNEAETFLDAVGLHFDHLKFMGRGDDLKKAN